MVTVAHEQAIKRNLAQTLKCQEICVRKIISIYHLKTPVQVITCSRLPQGSPVFSELYLHFRTALDLSHFAILTQKILQYSFIATTDEYKQIIHDTKTHKHFNDLRLLLFPQFQHLTKLSNGKENINKIFLFIQRHCQFSIVINYQ